MISIIIPVYNVENYLQRCVDSILSQTFKDFELILVDDGSTDQSPTICDKYKIIDSRIKVIHKKNGGVSSARNAGLEVIGGEYISFVDSDDWLHPRALEFLMRALNDHKTDCATMENIWVDSEVVFPQYKYAEINKRYFVIDQIKQNIYKFVYQPQLKDVISCGLFAIYQTELFSNIRFDENVGYGEDVEMLCRLNQRIRSVVHLDIPLYYYFTGNLSATRSELNKNHFGDLDVLLGITSWYMNIEQKEAEKFQYRYIYRFFDFLLKVKNTGNPELDCFFSNYRKVFLEEYQRIIRNPYLKFEEKVMLWLLKHNRSECIWFFGKCENRMLKTLESFIK